MRAKEKPKNLDDRIVPSDMMHKYYRNDNYEELFLKSKNELKKLVPAKIIAIRNESDNLEKLKLEIDRTLTELKKSV